MPRQSQQSWSPQRGSQLAFHKENEVFELLYGGAAGGGKSDSLLVEALRYAHMPNYSAIIFRRSYPEIEKSLVPRAYELYSGRAKPKNKGLEWHFPGNGVIYLSHLQREEDKEKHKSTQYDFIGFDELTSFSETQYTYLFSRCRGTSEKIVKRIRSATNPTGPGHSWVRERFIDLEKKPDEYEYLGSREYEFARGWRSPDGHVHTAFDTLPKDYQKGNPEFSEEYYHVFKDKASGLTRAFIPALLWGNAVLIKNDPNYFKRVMALPIKQQKALLYGSWDVFEGQFFSEWDPSIHLVDDFKIPDEWKKFVAIDYGYTAPFCALWFALSPEGVVYCYRELYAKRLSTENQARDVTMLTGEEKLEWATCDPSMFARQGNGESHADVYARHGMYLVPSSNRRVAGWALVHEFLMNGRLKIFKNCQNLIRTLPTLMHSKSNPEDIDTQQEDHCFTGDTLVDTLWGKKRIDSLVGKEPYVMTKNGFRKARSVRCTGEKEVWQIVLSNGVKFKCTPDHKFLTNNGWKELKDIGNGIEVLIQSGICIKSYLILFKNLMANAITSVGNTFSTKAKGCIARFGNFIMAKSPRIFTSIIKTVTGRIIAWKIWGLFRDLSTFLYTQALRRPKKGLGKILRKPLNMPQNGTSLRLEENGTVDTPKRYGKILNGLRRCVLFAKKNIARLRARKGSPNTAVSIVAKLPLGKERVFDLTVPSTGNFTIHNGIVVHNCADSLRYMLLTLRGMTTHIKSETHEYPSWWTQLREKNKKRIVTAPFKW